MIYFTVPGLPISQPRQRHRALVTHGGQTITTNYTPAKHPVQAWKATVRLAAQQAHPGPLLQGPVGISIGFVFPRPGRLRWKKKPMPGCWHESKPDIENLVKALLDALTGVCWQDDAQVVLLWASKRYGAGGESSHTMVKIRTLSVAEVDLFAVNSGDM